MDAALSLTGPAAGVAVCPMAAVAVAAANVTDKRKTRRSMRMPASLSWLARDHASRVNFIPESGNCARLFSTRSPPVCVRGKAAGERQSAERRQLISEPGARLLLSADPVQRRRWRHEEANRGGPVVGGLLLGGGPH